MRQRKDAQYENMKTMQMQMQMQKWNYANIQDMQNVQLK